MDKKKRKRIVKRVVQVAQKDNYLDFEGMEDNDYYPADEVGHATTTFVQCTTRMVYETFGKASECSNNMRQHYRRDGKSKVGFDSLDKAKSACTRLWDKNEDMSPYKCSLCKKFHIGHKNGEGHSVPYKIYKIGEMAGALIDCVSAMKRLFANDDSAYPHQPPYHESSTIS